MNADTSTAVRAQRRDQRAPLPATAGADDHHRDQERQHERDVIEAGRDVVHAGADERQRARRRRLGEIPDEAVGVDHQDGVGRRLTGDDHPQRGVVAGVEVEEQVVGDRQRGQRARAGGAPRDQRVAAVGAGGGGPGGARARVAGDPDPRGDVPGDRPPRRGVELGHADRRRRVEAGRLGQIGRGDLDPVVDRGAVDGGGRVGDRGLVRGGGGGQRRQPHQRRQRRAPHARAA
ncbi:MAG: hypothetical protein IPL61_23185 [Myxococcales bacterium]|nr:hypothetical protein [Myxococcales bacterium]